MVWVLEAQGAVSRSALATHMGTGGYFSGVTVATRVDVAFFAQVVVWPSPMLCAPASWAPSVACTQA